MCVTDLPAKQFPYLCPCFCPRLLRCYLDICAIIATHRSSTKQKNIIIGILQSPVQSIRGKNLDFSRSTIPTVSRYEKCGVFGNRRPPPLLLYPIACRTIAIVVVVVAPFLLSSSSSPVTIVVRYLVHLKVVILWTGNDSKPWDPWPLVSTVRLISIKRHTIK